MEDLASTITSKTRLIPYYLASQNVPEPSNLASAPGNWPPLPQELANARSDLRAATLALHNLTTGPRNALYGFA
ncbi:hypothetical protein LTS18_001876, partial [Coniosporium uncinatum]